jgi:hypothetical protein
MTSKAAVTMPSSLSATLATIDVNLRAIACSSAATMAAQAYPL